jgi:hypothetical protein
MEVLAEGEYFVPFNLSFSSFCRLIRDDLQRLKAPPTKEEERAQEKSRFTDTIFGNSVRSSASHGSSLAESWPTARFSYPSEPRKARRCLLLGGSVRHRA